MMDPNNLPHHVYLHKDHKYRLKLGFYAAPSNPKAFSKAIRDELHNLKFTYCSDLNGLIMGFGKISANELIPADVRHCINVVVNVDVYIFRPPVGSIIEAVVNQTSDNHVSCLVHNLFNVSIVRPENKPCDQWSGSKIKKDDKIDVKVLSFDLTKKLPHITGEIIKKKDECYDPKNTIHNSFSTKSSSSKHIVSDINKNTAKSLTFSSSDSESSDEMNNMITKSKIYADGSTKTPLLINTTIKHVQKEDTAVTSSKLTSNDSDSSTEINNMITNSKKCEDKSTKKSPVSTNTTIKNQGTADNSLKMLASDSESSTEINNTITNSKKCKNKSTKKSPVSNNATIKHQDTAESSSKLPSSDSDSSIEVNNMITNSKKCEDKSTKKSLVSTNTTIKNQGTANSSLELLSSDSESSTEINNTITNSKQCEDKSTKKSPVSNNTTIKHQDTAESSSELSSSDSEFSSKVKLASFEKCLENKSTRKSSLFQTNIKNSKHNEGPLYSSTPISNSEHSVNSINLIRNKQLEQLKKHLDKNNTGKRKSLDSVNVSNQFVKNKLSQSLNVLKNIENNDNNDNPPEFLAASVNTIDSLGSSHKINLHGNLQGDSVISDTELGHNNISVDNSFSRKSEKSTKTTKKHRKSNTIVNAILNSINLNSKKSNANITNNLTGDDKKEKNTIYTQHEHNLDEGIPISPKNLNKAAVKNSLTLNLSTKNKRKEVSPQKKNTDDSGNQIKNKIFKKCSMLSDSDSNCSKDLKLSVKNLSHTTDSDKDIENDTSSSDDEIYSRLRQNISSTLKSKDYLDDKPKSKSLLYNEVLNSTNESDSSSKLFYNASKLSSKLTKSNVTKHNSINISETDDCNKSNDNNLLSNKKTFKKDTKNKKANEKYALPQLSDKIINKMDVIKHILDKDSSSDGEVTTLKNKSNDEKVSGKKSTLNVSKLNKNDGLKKDILNPFLKRYTENITSSSSDDETFVKNLIKSKTKSPGKQKKIPLVNEEEKKNILIDQVLTSIKRKNKKQKQILPVSQTNSNTSETKKILKSDKITKDKPIVKNKNKKDILNSLKKSIAEPKPNVPNLNISQKVNTSQLNIQPSSNESTDEEEDVIKKILKKRKLKKTKTADVPEQSMKINIPTKSNKQNEIKKKLHTKSKSQDVSMIDEVKNNDIKKKKKRPRETSLLDSVISALEKSTSDYAPSKKKKTDHNLTIKESHGSIDKNSDCNLSEVKMKKKKKSKHKDNFNLSDLIGNDSKKKPNDSSFESSPKNKNLQANLDNTFVKVSKKKKKKAKSDPVFNEIQTSIIDKSSKKIDTLDDNVKLLKNTGSSKKKAKKLLESQMKSFMLTQDNTNLDHLYDLLSTRFIQS